MSRSRGFPLELLPRTITKVDPSSRSPRESQATTEECALQTGRVSYSRPITHSGTHTTRHSGGYHGYRNAVSVWFSAVTSCDARTLTASPMHDLRVNLFLQQRHASACELTAKAPIPFSRTRVSLPFFRFVGVVSHRPLPGAVEPLADLNRFRPQSHGGSDLRLAVGF